MSKIISINQNWDEAGSCCPLGQQHFTQQLIPWVLEKVPWVSHNMRMGYLQDQIAQQVKNIRDSAEKYDLAEKLEPLRVVPVVAKRCFAPCGVGRCNCYPTVGHHFCVVFESRLNSCSQEFLNGMAWMQDQVEKAMRSQELTESEQSDVMDQLHISLKLANS